MDKIEMIEKAIGKISGNSFVAMDTVTEVKLKGGKKNTMQGRVQKHTKTGSCMIFSNQASNGYENMVKRRLEKEGKPANSFQLGERAWGKRLTGKPFVEHKGEMYLECIFMGKPESFYTLDGLPVDKNTIEGLESKDEGNQGGLDNKVIIRTYNCKNIRAIRIDGKEYKF